MAGKVESSLGHFDRRSLGEGGLFLSDSSLPLAVIFSDYTVVFPIRVMLFLLIAKK